MSAREAIIARLREQLRAADRTRLPGRRGVAALGVPAIDAALPWRGLARGGVHELLGGDGDAARFGFAAALLGRLPVGGGRILWCRGGHATREIGRPYGPGLAGFGLAPERLLFFETRCAEEALWAIEEGLRCRRLAAVVGEGVATGLAASRRLQLAAEAGDTLGLLLPAPGKAATTAAFTQWRIDSWPGSPEAAGLGASRWRVALQRCRGGGTGEWLVEFDDEALCLAVVAALADRSLAAE